MTPEFGAIAPTPGGSIALGGSFQGTVSFGPPAGSVTSAMMQDGFLLVLTP